METFCRHQISHLSTVFLGGISFHCPMPKNLVKNKLKYLNSYVTGEKLRDVWGDLKKKHKISEYYALIGQSNHVTRNLTSHWSIKLVT